MNRIFCMTKIDCRVGKKEQVEGGGDIAGQTHTQTNISINIACRKSDNRQIVIENCKEYQKTPRRSGPKGNGNG